MFWLYIALESKGSPTLDLQAALDFQAGGRENSKGFGLLVGCRFAGGFPAGAVKANPTHSLGVFVLFAYAGLLHAIDTFPRI